MGSSRPRGLGGTGGTVVVVVELLAAAGALGSRQWAVIRVRAADGAAYDPRLNRWHPIAGRAGAAMAATAWTGTRMLVWDTSAGRISGALDDPVGDRWIAIRPGPALGVNHSGPVWTGTQLIAWNGATPNLGIAYAPAVNRWSTLPPAPLASGDRSGAAMVWDRPRGPGLEWLEHRDSIAALP